MKSALRQDKEADLISSDTDGGRFYPNLFGFHRALCDFIFYYKNIATRPQICYNENKKGGGNMNNNLFSKIDGKSIIVCNFSIEHYDETLAVKMSCVSEDENACFIVFENVSKLKLSEISYPFQICGFEILDYSDRGYQKDTRFYVNDYEDGTLSFFCKSFEIFDANR